MKTAELFDDLSDANHQQFRLGEGALLLRGFVKDIDHVLINAVETVVVQAPFRHMVTPGGFRMSVAMTNCGPVGWVSDAGGYRYDPIDPASGRV